MPTLGEELRRLREEKGLSLREVSDSTHIGSRFLQAIESDNYSILPGGIFNRGFVRSYARYVGLDEEQALVLYNQQLEAQGGEAPRSTAPSWDGIEEEVSSPWGTIALIILTLLILSAGVYMGYRYFISSAPAPTTADATTPESGSVAAPSVTVSESPSPLPTTEGSPTVSPSPSESASPALPLIGNLQVKVQIGENQCWLKVKSDANPAAEGTLNPGDVREFSASEKMVLSFGNAVGITATLNGRPMKLPITKGVSSYVVLTKDNYQTYLQ
ncbi:MAG: helix-turn-helix domain-containing protein [Blastocatellia bacterium]|nr:helix-turn-helix domain-containing protein [Blastocatellia bacterium]